MKKKESSIEIIRYKIAQDKGSQFEADYSKACEILKTSPYCLGYEIIHGTDEPDNYIVIIYWTSADDHINGFRKNKEFGPFFNLVKAYYNNIQEMKHYKSTDIEWSRTEQ